MIKIGVTGQNGFVGKYLINTLKLKPEIYEVIHFENSYFESEFHLEKFVSSCDGIVHLAAMNRHPDPQVIFDTNVGLVKKLVSALKKINSKTHVVLSSSIQEAQDNLYGKSKKIGRELLENWAKESRGKCTGLIIPNVFGPFGKPNYNSVVATFCQNLMHGEQPSIINDSEVALIYVGDLVKEIIDIFENTEVQNLKKEIKPTKNIKVSEILCKLNYYKELYFDNCQIPELKDKFDIDLFNTFRSFIDLKVFFPKKMKLNTDKRGTFVETIRLGIGGQASYSTTEPGVTRGNHYHTRKIERFAVIKGKAIIQIRKIGTDEVINFNLNGTEPAFVDMPIWYTHNIKNIGKEELFTIFWINEWYDPADTDTYFETV
jgi:UDP-2-acetamido-2,6-beta-L-arabino-hexul-4-ose reductase